MKRKKAMRRIRRAEPRAKCPKCGREVTTYVPKGGDGTFRYLRTHREGSEWHKHVEAPGWEMRKSTP